MKKTIIISAFPGCGKTYATDAYKDKYNMLDSDSSRFSWIINGDKKERNPEFPANYIRYIKNNIGKVDIIFVSSHKIVRDTLKDAGIKFITIRPDIDCRLEWAGRFYLRGNGENFIKNINDHWYEFIREMDMSTPRKQEFILNHNEFIDRELLGKIVSLYDYIFK